MRIDGARFLDETVRRLRAEIAAAGAPPVCLATVLVSDDPRDLSNARRKHVRAREAGMQFRHVQFAAHATQSEVEHAIDDLSNDDAVHGVFVQLPLPRSLDARALARRIPARKNVDGPVPATALGIVRLLEFGGVRTTGASVVVGSSAEIAVPTAQLLAGALVSADAPDLLARTRQAETLVSAAERPRLITAAHVKPGAAVVDAGYNRTEHGVIGDVALEDVERVARAVVPMPGGIGPATIACLLERTWAGARG